MEVQLTITVKLSFLVSEQKEKNNFKMDLKILLHH